MGADFSFWLMLTVAVVTGDGPRPMGQLKDLQETLSEESPQESLDHSTTEKGSGGTGTEGTAETINPEAMSTLTEHTAGGEGNNPEESLGATAPPKENGRTIHEETVAPNVRNTIEDGNRGRDLEVNVALIQATPSDNVNEETKAEKATAPNLSTVTDDGHEGTDPEGNVILTESIVPENENRGTGGVTSTEDEPLMSTEMSFKNEGAKVAPSLRQSPSHVSSKTSTDMISSVSPPVVGNEEELEKSFPDSLIENQLKANDAMIPSDSSNTLDKQPAADDARGTEDNNNTLDDVIIKPKNGKSDATTNSAEIRGAGKNYVEESNVYKGENDSLFINNRSGFQGDGLITTPAVIRENMHYNNTGTYTENRPNSSSNPISKPIPTEQTKENKQISDKEKNVLANKNGRDENDTEQSLAKVNFDSSNINHRHDSQDGGVTNNSTAFTKNKMASEPPKTNTNRSVTTETREPSSNPTSIPNRTEQTEENKQIFDTGKNKTLNKTDSGKGQGKGEENHRSPNKQPERKLNHSEVRNTSMTRNSATAPSVQRKTTGKPLQSASRRPKTGSVATATKTNTTEPTTLKQKLTTLLGKAVTPLTYAVCVFVGACIVASIFVSL